MFHVVLILLPLLFLVIAGSLLLFGVTSIAISVFGGTTAALLIKNKTAKYLLLCGFVILLLVGSLTLLPFVAVYAGVSAGLMPIIGTCMLGFIAAVAIGGIKFSSSIQNKTGRTLLIVLFSIVCVLAGVLLFLILS
ncbi:hypothetical protein JZO70_14135 [Enterococcus sp. 669A]|uniref:Uncharacterized protein n=1 Tax=Candidatus Enterococcus moelleringii TaxID=2815325 RepID=A0ABS3LCF2_9ENTE|nr:hypothetical protein [Enterococcus sp. 669A]MBO1307313.1 hypothetical protein [Enterococcus sp. 669A]